MRCVLAQFAQHQALLFWDQGLLPCCCYAVLLLCRCTAVPSGKEMMVHSGFLGAYDSVKAKIFRIVDQVTANRSPAQTWTVFVTGHSLGGALATLASYELAGRK